MRVLVVTPSAMRPGGIANYYAVLRNHLGRNVEYFTIGARGGAEGRLKRCLRALRDYRAFRREVRYGDYDIVLLNPSLLGLVLFREGIFLLIARRYARRVIVFFRGWHVDSERRIRGVFLKLFQAVYLKASTFIVLSAEYASVLKELGCTQPIFVETTVVADEVFASPLRCWPDDHGAQRRGEFRVLFLSRLEKTKGIYEALEAISILRSMGRCVTMTVAGSGREASAVREYLDATHLDGIRCVGHVAGRAKEAAFVGADVYLLPTYGEGMPNSVLEAMSYGLPVVTRPVGGLCDFFEHGQMGIAVESLDPRDFASALAALADDPGWRARIGRYNREYACKQFMASEVGRRLEAICQAVMDGEPGVCWSGGLSARAHRSPAATSLIRLVGEPSDAAGNGGT